MGSRKKESLELVLVGRDRCVKILLSILGRHVPTDQLFPPCNAVS